MSSLLAVVRAEPSQDAATAATSTVSRILDVIRPRAQRLALWMERAWQAGASSPDQGLAVTAGEVAWLLLGEEADRQEAAFLETDARAAALTGTIRQAESALARDPRWAAVTEAFSPDEAERDLLLLLVAAEADPGLRRVIAYLNDDTRLDRPTAQLSRRLAGRPRAPWRCEAIVRWRLAEPVDDAQPQALTTPWRLDPAVMAALTDAAWRDPILGEAVRVVGANEVADAAALHPAALATLRACADPRDVELIGPKGVGRETLAARFALGRGQALLAVDVAGLLTQGLAVRDILTRALRQAKAMGALAYFRDAEAVAAAEWDLARGLRVDYLRGARERAAGETIIALAPPALAERLALWRRWSGATPPGALTTHRLTPAEIKRLAFALERLGAEGVASRPMGGRRPDHSLLSLLPCPYDWDDLILPGEVDRALRDFADQIRLRWSVYDDWGFGRLTHLGFGVAALFAGPSGTGKTMAAQVIAKTLGLDLYRVDLAGVVNKYVGETEKRLREVFDACEHSGALLFFDEADALFGGRMQAKDAHDRFANIETNYLLQRIETFDGVAILATNRRNDIDQAFMRRLRFIIEFMPPRPEERLALWRRALRTRSPSGEDLLDSIDFNLLAERLQMTGAEIKSTVLSAAFLAKARDQRIGMGHLFTAAERELAKQRAKLPVSLRDGVTG
jgi:hypothetical protein